MYAPDAPTRSHFSEEITKADRSPRCTAFTVCLSFWAAIRYLRSIYPPEECQQKYRSAPRLPQPRRGTSIPARRILRPFILVKIIDGETSCVHSSLSPDINTLDQIRVLSRMQEIPHEGAVCGMSNCCPAILSPSLCSRGACRSHGPTQTTSTIGPSVRVVQDGCLAGV